MRPDDRTIWYNIAITDGIGPAKCQLIWRRLEESLQSVDAILDRDETWIGEELGLSSANAINLAEQLRNIRPAPADDRRWQVVLPGDDRFPSNRFGGAVPPLPALLWSSGATDLLNFTGRTIAVAGSRETSEEISNHAEELAGLASSRGILVVSGLAAGIDSAAHRGALRGGTGTVGVLASGIARAANIENLDWDDRLCIVSEFSPDEPWSPQRAMQRNGTIASLSDRVVVIAASKSGGSWEMAQLCLKKKKPLYVLDLPPEVAAGNRSLIKSGARPFSTDEVESCLNFDESLGPDQPSLF